LLRNPPKIRDNYYGYRHMYAVQDDLPQPVQKWLRGLLKYYPIDYPESWEKDLKAVIQRDVQAFAAQLMERG